MPPTAEMLFPKFGPSVNEDNHVGFYNDQYKNTKFLKALRLFTMCVFTTGYCWSMWERLKKN